MPKSVYHLFGVKAGPNLTASILQFQTTPGVARRVPARLALAALFRSFTV